MNGVFGDGGGVRLRLMRAEDAFPAAKLEAESSHEPWSEKSFLDAVLNENTVYLAAEKNGRLIGCCGLWQSFDEAEIVNVAVSEDCRRAGVGQRLLTELIKRGAERGILRYTLEVRKGNAAAVRLYEKLGFVTEGVRRNFYTNPAEDALIMWKR